MKFLFLLVPFVLGCSQVQAPDTTNLPQFWGQFETVRQCTIYGGVVADECATLTASHFFSPDSVNIDGHPMVGQWECDSCFNAGVHSLIVYPSKGKIVLVRVSSPVAVYYIYKPPIKRAAI